MSGFTGNDGSELAGGLTPSGTIKGLSVDNAGNLNVNASVSSGPTNITQINSAAVSATNGLPVSGNNGGSLVVLDVDSSGRLYVNITSLPALAAGSNNIGGVEIFDSGGANKLAIDASGRVLVGVSTATLYTSAQTNTGSGNSGDLDVSKLREISIDITTTLVTTNLQFFWERKGTDGNYYPLWQSALLTASANTLSTSIGPGLAYNQSLGPTGRLRWTATGNASFTPNIFGK